MSFLNIIIVSGIRAWQSRICQTKASDTPIGSVTLQNMTDPIFVSDTNYFGKFLSATLSYHSLVSMMGLQNPTYYTSWKLKTKSKSNISMMAKMTRNILSKRFDRRFQSPRFRSSISTCLVLVDVFRLLGPGSCFSFSLDRTMELILTWLVVLYLETIIWKWSLVRNMRAEKLRYSFPYLIPESDTSVSF